MQAKDTLLVTLLPLILISGILMLIFPVLRNPFSQTLLGIFIVIYVIQLIGLIFFGIDVT